MTSDFSKKEHGMSVYNEPNGNDYSIDECREILYVDSRIKFFFEASLPAAKKRGEVLGHVLFICPDDYLRTCFLRLLQYSHEVNYRVTAFNAIKQPSDLASILTNLSQDDAFVCEAHAANIADSYHEILSMALRSFAVDIVIGKGPSARSIRLDLPKFTFVTCVSEETNSIRKLLPLFEYVIKVDKTVFPRLCAEKLCNSAKAFSINLDDSARDLIISKARNDITMAERYMKRILEYVSTQEKQLINITEDLVEHVFEISGLNMEFDTTSERDEVIEILRDIRETLHLMHSGLQKMHDDINDGFNDVGKALWQLNGEM